MQTEKPDHVLDSRSSAGPSVGSMKGVLFGTSSDADHHDEYLLHFFEQIEKGVNLALKGINEPLIPCGVEHELALYRRVSTHGHLVEPGIHGAPDGLEMPELQRRALELLQERPPSAAVNLLSDFDKKVGAGLGSVQIGEIVIAAYLGRVFHLYFQESARYSGTFDLTRRRVKHTEDPLDKPVDLIEIAARETIAHAGEAHVVAGSKMPNGVPVCAIFRYAAMQPAVVTGEAGASVE
jgi:hypothetical protein